MPYRGEQVSYDWFGSEWDHPSITGYDRYDVATIPYFLRTRDYDELLASAMLPDEPLPDDWQAEYEQRRNYFKNFREQIASKDVRARALIGEAALLQVIGGDLPFEARAGIQQNTIESIREDVLNNNYQVAIVGFNVDTRIVSTGSFSIVSYSDRPVELVNHTRSAIFVEAREGDPRGVVERAQAAFDTIWQRSVHDREQVADYLSKIAGKFNI